MSAGDRIRLGLLGGNGEQVEVCQRALAAFAEVSVLTGPDPPAGLPGIDLLLLFVRDPHVDGVRSFAAYRMAIPSLPVIVVGKGLDVDHAVELVKWGAADYVCVEPDGLFDFVVLWRKVERVAFKRVQLTVDTPALEPLTAAHLKMLLVDGPDKRACFRVRTNPKHPASFHLRLGPADVRAAGVQEVRFAIYDLSVATEERAGGMLLRGEGAAFLQTPAAVRQAGAKATGLVKLPGEPTPVEVSVEIRRVELSPSRAGGIVWLGTQYMPTDPRNGERFRRYWVQCQRERPVLA